MRRRLDAAGYRRGQDAAADGRAPVGAVRPLGQISREHVRRPRRDPQCRRGRAGPVGRGGADGAEADELPGARPDLPPGHQILSRPAAPPGRVRLLPPQRAAWRAARHHARPPVHPGRCPYLLPRGSDRRGDAAPSATCSTSIYRDLGFADYAIKLALAPGQALRQRRDVGPGRAGSARGGPSRRPRRPRISAGKSCPARAPSTRPSSNST